MQAEDQAIVCPYDGCSRSFDTSAELRLHKDMEPDHYYCRKCDLDCTDWVDLTQHKVNLMAPFLEGTAQPHQRVVHIVCEFCGEDFKTFGGRNIHREKYHTAEQNILCMGCDRLFVKASGMLDHLERNQCAGITSYDFRRAIQKKYIMPKILEEGVADNLRRLGAPSTTNASNAPTIVHDDGNESDDDGGVSLCGTQGGLSEALASMSVTSSSTQAGGELFGGHKEVPSGRGERKSAAMIPWKDANASKSLFPTAKPTPATTMALAIIDEAHKSIQTSQNLFDHNICDVGSTDWDPERFYDPIIECYLCPFPGCASLTFSDAKGIEQHFVFGHTKTHFPCPACLKVFPRPSLLIGHIEETSRCKIRKSKQFHELVSDISGGYLKVKPVIQPRVHRPSTAVIKAGKVIDGVMSAEFKSILPELPREPRW